MWSAPAFLIGLREGWNTPAFSVAAALTIIVILDASSLRRRVGDHAAVLNRLHEGKDDWRPLRERMGHHPIEIAAGLVTGLGCGFIELAGMTSRSLPGARRSSRLE